MSLRILTHGSLGSCGQRHAQKIHPYPKFYIPNSYMLLLYKDYVLAQVFYFFSCISKYSLGFIWIKP
ncbi:MAG: hypothetical protein NZ455_13375 [Bacteroidia bacterium]|nr:hypothetical protein [Bacteroidia bacterium]